MLSKNFEHRSQHPISQKRFYFRVLGYLVRALLLTAFALGLGMTGYHYLEGLSWLDSFLNASMILGGMGPVDVIKTQTGKLFAGCYALFSGLIFLVVAGLLFSPVLHRVLHRFHFEGDKNLN